MGLVGEGIRLVRACELPGGIWADGGFFGAPRVALVEWSADAGVGDKLFQVYVNGRYAGATADVDQRRMIVPLPASLETPVRVEVFAVEQDEAHRDFSDELDRWVGNGRVRLSLLRSQELPVRATAEVYFDNGTGTVDYDEPLNDEPIRIWPAWQDKAGHGMSRFGVGDFGYDGAAAVGFGRGCFGIAQFGLDADVIEWFSPALADGVYKFGVKVTDEKGNTGSGVEVGPVTVMRVARPVDELAISQFDESSGQLVLAIISSEG